MNKALALLATLIILPVGAYTAQPAHAPSPAAQQAFDRATALKKEKKPIEAMAIFGEAIEADPEFLAAHDGLRDTLSDWRREQYRKGGPPPRSALQEMNERILGQYQKWERRFPDSLGIAYGAGTLLWEDEDPRAKPYLLKIVAREPDRARVFYMLSVDAERWGDNKAATEYLHKATLAEPENAAYALGYASSLKHTVPDKYADSTGMLRAMIESLL